MATPIYHITHYRNLPKVLGRGGLACKRVMAAEGISYTNVAHTSIQDRRARVRVPCGPGGSLHEYVPFYFAPRSPMLYTIERGNVAGYEEGQVPIVHLVSSAEAIRQSGVGFVFTDGHAIMELSDFFDDLSALDRIDWPLMSAKMWNDTPADPDRSRRRQAEFLVRDFLPWNLITGIGVLNQQVKAVVEDIIRAESYRPPVSLRPSWYYS